MFPLLLCAIGLTAAADQPGSAPQPVRTILGRHDQSGVPGKEIVIGTAIIPAGATLPFHTHAGDEAGFLRQGSLVLKTRGQPDRSLKAGDSFFNPRGAAHSVTAGPDGAIAESVWIVDKGGALATPAP
jgi:quercetin dioxygenase-like cupin family protein